MTSLIYLSTCAPSVIADDLIRAGYQVWEALSVSEVLYLLEHQKEIEVVLIAPDVEDRELIAAQLRRPTIQLKPRATAQDVMWFLSTTATDRTPPTVH